MDRRTERHGEPVYTHTHEYNLIGGGIHVIRNITYWISHNYLMAHFVYFGLPYLNE